MKGDKEVKPDFVKEWERKWIDKGFVKYVVDDITFFFPPLVGRSRCFTFNPEKGCLYCGNKSFRYFSSAGGKKYYQCEKCCGVNH
jgi:hypothetical protein